MRTTILSSKFLNVTIFMSGSYADPYAHLYIAKPNSSFYKPLNIKFRRVTLGSSCKAWRWSNRTPKIIKDLYSLRDAVYVTQWGEDVRPFTKFQIIKTLISQKLCNHDYDVEDYGNAENGPEIHGCCKKCGKSF